MRSPFLDRLDRGPLVADGAIGTSLHERGVVWGRSLDEVTLTNRPLVLQLHVDYLLAGAELITSNTFGANRIRLAEFGLDEQVRDLNMFAVKTAREAREISGRAAFIAGAVGPVGRPGGGPRHREKELSAAFAEQVSALLEGGADVIMLETFSDLIELEIAVDACRASCDLPVLASMTFDAQHRTAGDLKPEDIAERLLELDVDVAGVNCSTGPQSALDVLERLRAAGLNRIAVMPNAGLASRRGADFFYLSTPTYFADYATRFVDAGAAIVGGCCGTSPRHTAAMALALEDRTQRAPSPQSVLSFQGEPSVEERVALTQEPTRLTQALAAGEFVVSVELAPPKGINPEKVIAGAQLLASKGLKFVNITDSAMARVRMGATAVAKLVQEHTQLESIIHYTTRDRNLMAIQSELIGAHALGVRNVLALTGDPPSVGEYPDATGVWDVESMGLVEVVNRMNEGNDARGRDIGPPAGFCVGCAVNPTAVDMDVEIERFEQKLAAGAHFIMSQPLYDLETLTRFLERVGDLPVPFLLGILPLQSSRHAEYMHNEVPGIEVPQPLRDAMVAAGADGIPTGIAQAQEFIAEAQSLVDGIYLMPSFGRYEMCGEVLDALDSARRPGKERQPFAG